MSLDITSLSISVKSDGVKEASNALGGLSTSAGNAEKRVTTFVAAMEKLNLISANATNSMNSYMAKLQQQAALMQSMGTSSASAASSTQALAAAMAVLAASMNALSLRTQDADRSQRRHNEGMAEAHALARGLSGSLGMLWATYGNLAGMAVGIAIGASLKGIVTVGKDVENTLEAIRVKGGETVESVNAIRTSVMDLGKGIYGPQEVAKAFETMILAGLSAKQALAGINDALNLATIGGTSIEKSAYTIVQVGTALNYSAESYNRIADVIAMTAAVSMSSVESLSEAFKSGSVVGKLYGVTLVDIGTSLAALSNLGIQGSAAGTSLKNFYKELASSSDKVKQTLESMKLTPASFKDDEGNYLGLLQVVEKLAGGLDSLTGAQQKIAIANLSNERGMKTAIEVLDLYRQKVDVTTESGVKHSNMLEGLRAKIEESYGYAAIGAAQMSLTVENQFKSVSNTLKTVFLEAFQQVSPQLTMVASQVKTAFNSPEFVQGITAIAVKVADLTVALAENIPLIVKLVEAFLAAKAIMFVVALFESISVALKAVAAGAALANIALGPLAIALIAAGAAYAYFSRERDATNMSQTQQTSIKYSEDYADALNKEATRLTEQLELLKQSKNARDAETESMYKQQLALAKLQGDKAKREAEDRLDKAGLGVTLKDLEISDSIVKRGGQMTGAVKEFRQAQQNLIEVNGKVDSSFARVVEGQKAVMAAAKALEVERQRLEKENKPKSTGTGVIGDGPDKAAISDTFQAQLASYQNQIRAAKRELEATKADALSQYKQGLMGERGLIEANYTAEKTLAEKAIGLIQQKIDAAKGAENKKALATKFQGDLDAQQDALDAASATRKNKYAENEVNNQKIVQKALQEKYNAEGKFAQAYEAEFKKKHDVQISGMLADIDKEKDAVVKAEEQKIVAILNGQYEAGLAHAQNKENLASFMELSNATRNALKGVQTSSENQGLAAMFEAASAASATLAANMDELRARMSNLTDPAAINEAQAQLTNLGESQRKMWAGVGESISKSLESAFGKSGKAAGDLIKIGQNYANLENKSGEARIKAYGDAAGAAKGFFKEGTTGYQVMAAAEKAFRLIELAGMAKSLAMNIANASATATAWIPAVYASFMAALGPWGTAAAAIALAAVGISALGGGSAPPTSEQRQKTQGTGSVLGMSEAKSESVVNSLAIMEKNSGLGLAQGNQMVNYLRAVADNITNLSSLIVRTTGITGDMAPGSKGAAAGVAGSTLGVAVLTGGIGLILDKLLGGKIGNILGSIANSIFGGKVTTLDTGFTASRTTVAGAAAGGFNANQYTDTKKDGGWFSSDKYSTSMSSLGGDANNQFSAIVSNMSSALKEASKALGMDGAAFNSRLEGFVIDIGKISLKGLTGDEIQKQLEAVFSKLGDDMARFAFMDFGSLQKVGEGFLQTVARVANDVLQVKDVFAVLNKTFNLTGTAAATVSENLISAAGGLEKLTSGAKYFVDNFLTEAEKMEPIAASVKTVMGQLGYSSVTTIEGFSKLVRSLDLTDPASQKLFASLMDIAPAFKDAADYATKLAEGTVTLTKAQQKALDAVNKAKGNLQDAYNAESSALQSTIDKTKAFVLTLKNYQDGLKLGADSPLTNMQKYAEAKKQFDATALAAQNGDQAAKDKFVSASSALLAASKVINASGSGYTNDFNMVQKAIDDLMGTSGKEVDVAQASLDALNKQVAGLIDINKSVMSVTDAIIALQNAIALGKSAGLTNAQMDTTYTPTPQQVAAATAVTASTGAKAVATADVVAAIDANTAAIKEQTAAQAAQTGAVVGAVHNASDDNADVITKAFTRKDGFSYNNSIEMV